MRVGREHFISLFLSMGLTGLIVLAIFYFIHPGIYLAGHLLGYHLVMLLLLASTLVISCMMGWRFSRRDSGGMTVAALVEFMAFMVLIYLVYLYFDYPIGKNFYIDAILGALISAIYFGLLFYLAFQARNAIRGIIKEAGKSKIKKAQETDGE